MFQILPALIFLLLQSQGYACRVTSSSNAPLSSNGSEADYTQPTNRIVREFQRVLLARLRSSNETDRFSQIQSIEMAVKGRSETTAEAVRKSRIRNDWDLNREVLPNPQIYGHRYRDGPSLIV